MEVNKIFQQFMFWGIWIIIPFVWELLAGFISMAVATAEFLKKDRDSPAYAPEVSILIPVHNSQKTLKNCLASIAAQEYPKEKMEVVLIDNGSRDKSYEVFRAFQEGQPELRLWWVESEKGKANALNKGIFGSKGKYIINIDSDGCLDKQAVKNVVARFEADDRIACMTGVVLVDPGLIEKSGSRLLKTLRRCELFEYTESFLVGRNYQSVFNSMYTMAGAFSCFRRETLMKTQLYNSETLGEDAHMSFQIKDFAGGRMLLCENAFFFVDPIESLDKLYIQRQRWQRAELEVARLFTHMHLGGIKGFLKSPSMRSLISDHTLTFPKLIWLFAMFCLYFMNYPLTLLLGANFLLYCAYVFTGFTYLLTASLYLSEQQDVRRYILKHRYICLVMPLYRFVVYWMRMAGIINSLTTESTWRAETLSEEIGIFGRWIERFSGPGIRVVKSVFGLLNRE